MFILFTKFFLDCYLLTDLEAAPAPKKRKRDELKIHKTGSARTEGFYKIDSKEKAKHKVTYHPQSKDY
jgi:hypothetical protein